MTERDIVGVRAYEESDSSTIATIFNQRSVALGTLQVPYMTAAERHIRWTASDTHRPLVAEINGRVVGHAGLQIFGRRRAHVGSFGMGVDEHFQRRGVGTALLIAILDLADNWYNLRRVELEVYCDNAAAIHLYEKFRFSIEGTHRAYAYRDGKYVDAYSMARLRDLPPAIAPAAMMTNPHG